MKKRIYQSNYPILFPVFLGFIFRLINIQSPIVGVHSWRQADTAAMARHFALQNTPIWLPQIDWSGASKGYVECEFPLFPYLVGQLYKLFGLHEWIGRGLSIFFSVLTIVLVIRIGTRLFDSASGWWGGVFFALLPLNVYYGRTFQAESLLIFFAALSIERFFAWERRSNFLDLFVSWLAFCLACLIKLMPFIWLGLPLIVFQVYSLNKNLKVSIKVFCGRLLKLASSPYLWAYFFGTILIGLIWFRYAYGLGLSTGLSFFLWGRDTDRVSLSMLFDLNVWVNLLLRITIRNLAIFGLPLAVIGLWRCKQEGLGQILQAGLVGIFICTAFAIRSSAVHEYYQLPLQLFLCPLMGRGWIFLRDVLAIRRFSDCFMAIIITLITTTSLTILSVDYFLVERNQTQIWMPLAQTIRKEVPSGSRIVSVTGLDPTVLNLARRQGWLTSPQQVNKTNIQEWISEGATHLVGSLDWKETYIRLDNLEAQTLLEKFQCDEDHSFCPRPPNYTYLIPLNQLNK